MPLILALPKGRIQDELAPLLDSVGLKPEPAFFDSDERALQFATNRPDVSIIRVRPFDVATFVAFGAAQIGVAGSDVLEEFDYAELYAPLDLQIGRCRLSLAAPASRTGKELAQASHVRIATKYPETTRRHFAARGLQAECIKLNGAMELAPALGLAPYIVDLVSSGQTLAANGLTEVETISEVSSRLIVSRSAFKTGGDEINRWIAAFREAVHEHLSP